ncbi:MAG: hypothetical protein LBO66_05945 [Deltaproteobacteria bacterium]|jgi:hypothetical protein|nr:hypothetical protein [Deltaproteobacteria bacterium]
MKASLLLAILTLFVASCVFAPLEPTRLAEMRQREAYLDLVRNSATHDEIYFFNDAGESLWLDAVNVGPALLSAARLRWGEDREFSRVMDKWLPRGQGRVVLLGIFNRQFQKDDFLKNGAYRAKLRVSGRTLAPDFMEEAPPLFWNNYFPAFNKWEKVFALRFPADPSLADATLIVEWPAGDRELPLKSPEI